MVIRAYFSIRITRFDISKVFGEYSNNPKSFKMILHISYNRTSYPRAYKRRKQQTESGFLSPVT